MILLRMEKNMISWKTIKILYLLKAVQALFIIYLFIYLFIYSIL